MKTIWAIIMKKTKKIIKDEFQQFKARVNNVQTLAELDVVSHEYKEWCKSTLIRNAVEIMTLISNKESELINK